METILLLVLFMLLSALFSGSEIGLYSLSRVKLRYKLSTGSRSATVMERLLKHMGPSIITILIGNNIAAQLLSGVSETALHGLGHPWSVIVTVLVLTPFLLIFGEFLPKHLFRLNADRWMYVMAWPLMILRLILAIPVFLIQTFIKILEALLPGDPAEIWEPHTSRPNLRTFFKAESSGHNLSEVQKGLLDRILAMERIDLRYEGVSKPVSVVAALDAEATVAAVTKNLGPKFFQRYLVLAHSDSTPIGYVTAMDLVVADPSSTISSLAKNLPSLPATTPVHDALQAMHEAGADLCLVDNQEDEALITFRGDCLRVLANLD